MSMINKTRLEEFANGLWAKIKQEVGEGIVSLSFEESTGVLTVTKDNNTTETVDLKALIGVKDGSYDNATKAITLTKGDDSTTLLDLSDLETKWENLEFTSEITFTNLIHGLSVKTGHYEESGNLNGSASFRSYVVPCIPGKTYRRTNRSEFQNTICNLRGGNNGETFIKNVLWKQTPLRVGGRQIWEVTIPLDSNITHFTLSYNNDVAPSQGTELMVWDASINPPSQFVGQTAKAEGVLIGNEIKMKFKPFQTGLTSTTVDDAIREIALKIATGGKVQSVNGQAPNEQGEITLNAGHFEDVYSKVETDGKFVLQTDVANQANKIPRIGSDGKLPSNIMPAIAINEVFQFTRDTQSEAERAAMGQASQNGDMMVLIVGASSSSRVTKKYLCVDAAQSTFAGRFVELTFPTDGITEGELSTTLQGYVLVSDTGIAANQVLRLDDQAKIDDSNLKIATLEEINAIINALQ